MFINMICQSNKRGGLVIFLSMNTLQSRYNETALFPRFDAAEQSKKIYMLSSSRHDAD